MKCALEIINTSQLSGGAEHLTQVTAGLRASGWRVAVACTADGPVTKRWQALGAEVVPVDLMRRRDNLHAIRSIRAAMRDLRPSLVHGHGTRAAFYACLAQAGRPRTPTIYTVHGFSFDKPRPRLHRTLYTLSEAFTCRRADRVIFVSESDAREARARRLLGRTPFEVIPNGVDLARFAARPEQRGRRVVATVARLVEQKGVEYFLRASGVVARRFPDSEFWIIGDGPLRPALAEAARAAGLNGNCRFLGASDRVDEWLARADLFVLPSLWEGLPIALLEAMAAGLPVIATDTSGSKEVIEKSGVGVLVPSRDSGALATAMERLLADAAARHRMGADARRAVAEFYGCEAMLRRTLALYERVAADHEKRY